MAKFLRMLLCFLRQALGRFASGLTFAARGGPHHKPDRGSGKRELGGGGGGCHGTSAAKERQARNRKLGGGESGSRTMGKVAMEPDGGGFEGVQRPRGEEGGGGEGAGGATDHRVVPLGSRDEGNGGEYLGLIRKDRRTIRKRNMRGDGRVRWEVGGSV